METNSASFDSSQSVHEYADMRRPEYCEMLNRSNDEIDQLNQHSTNPEFIELYNASSEHQYERVPYSTIEQTEDKSKDNLGMIKQIFIVVLVAVIIVTLVLLCVILGKYVSNMFSENRDLSKESNFTNKSDFVTTLDEKLKFVKEMMLDSWNAYDRYAWGHGELSPVKKRASSKLFGKYPGMSIVASMSTLWTMGLKEEFEKGRRWIETELYLSKVNKNVEVFDVIVNYVGGLLSCFALTNEQLFMNKALTIAQLVEPAFTTSTGIPFHDINPKTSALSGYNSYLSTVSGFQLDFNYLSKASGNDKYRKQIEKIQNVLKEMVKPKNLHFGEIDIGGRRISDTNLFSDTREFYISLVKSFIQSNQSDNQSIEMYKEVLDVMDSVKMFTVSPGGMLYVGGYQNNSISPENYMQYTSCFLGSMLSLGASAMQRALAQNSSIGDEDKVTQQNRINRHWHLAIQITRTCQLASDKTKTGLGPDRFYFNDTHDVILNEFFKYYALSPELAESNFILWRLTHNETYRDNAWKMAQAIHRHCRVEGGGYAEINDVNEVPTNKHDRQGSIFLSATLKYLYLTFTSDSVLPLDQFVFNSVGHPLPICGSNTMYPAYLCGGRYFNYDIVDPSFLDP